MLEIINSVSTAKKNKIGFQKSPFIQKTRQTDKRQRLRFHYQIQANVDVLHTAFLFIYFVKFIFHFKCLIVTVLC